MSEIRTFEDLEAWQACRAFRKYVHHQVLPLILKSKEFDLADQPKRSSRSATSNIAEGYGRFHYLDNRKFCSISRGSLFESLDHVITANDEDLVPESLLTETRALFEHSLKLLNGYMAYLKRASDSPQ